MSKAALGKLCVLILKRLFFFLIIGMQREKKHNIGVVEIKVIGLRRRHGKGDQQQRSVEKGVKEGIIYFLIL